MGCCSSGFSEYSNIAVENPQLAKWMKEFKALALSDQAVYRFWQIFKKIDLDGSGSIGITEMLVHFDIERTKFTKRVFSIFDEDGSGEIDLREFILALWNYCTLGKATLVIFAFDLYDKDGSGIIDSEELGLMLKEVYGAQYETNTYAKRILDSIRGMMCDAVDIDAFRKFAKKHPALLFPAFDVQRKMQDSTMGQRFWSSLANKRLKLSSGQYVPIKQYMELHLNQLVREDKEKVKNSIDAAHEKARGGTATRRGTKERHKSIDTEASETQILGVAAPDHARRTKERRKSRDMTNQPVEQKEPDDHVKNAIEAMAAAAAAQPIPQTQPDRSSVKGRDSVKNRSSTKDRSSVKAERKEALRRKTLDALQKHPSLTQIPLPNATGSAGTAPAQEPAPVGTFKGISTVARQRRKSTMDAQLPSQRNGDGAPDIYDALLALSKDVGGKHDERRKSNFEKLLAKNAQINP